MQAALLAGQDVDAAAVDEAQVESGAQAGAPTVRAAACAAIVDAPPLSPQSRLEIYRDAYRLRLIEALGESYPVLHQVLGDEDFEALTARFIAAHASRHRSIRWYGAELAEFAERTAPFSQQPLLGELARFEWTLAAAFDAADAAPLSREALKTLAPETWPDLRLEFHPSLHRLELEWNTVAVWQAVSDGLEAPRPVHLGPARPWILWRRGLRNFFRSLEGPEAEVLAAARAGACFGDLCAVLAETLPAADVPAYAARLVATWTEEGMIIGARTAAA